jgi:hypothetical protein
LRQRGKRLNGNERGGICSAHAVEEKYMQICFSGNLDGREYFGNLDLVRRRVWKGGRVRAGLA